MNETILTTKVVGNQVNDGKFWTPEMLEEWGEKAVRENPRLKYWMEGDDLYMEGPASAFECVESWL